MKPVKNMRAWVIALAFVITLTAFFSGQVISKKFKTTDPLKREFSKIKSIESFSINQADNGVNVNLKLGKVNNLRTILDKVQERVKFYYNKPVKSFTITNHANKRLEEVRYQLSFNLEEAVYTGRYLQLKDTLNSYRGLKVKVYFSPSFIYLQLEDGQNYYYEAYGRPVALVRDNTRLGGDTG
jgi:hypothetical protein